MINEETQAFIRDHCHDDVRKLALKRAPERVDLRQALQQIEGWQMAEKKLPSWTEKDGLWFPPRLSMEQCSSEQTARYKRELVARLLCLDEGDFAGMMVDFTGGFGIDFSFLAVLFRRAVYMERQSELCRIARHNFKILGLDMAEVCEGDSSECPQEWHEAALYYIDPARRDVVGRKTVAIEDCTPDLTLLQDDMLGKAQFCLVKLSPMLDIHAALRSLKHVCEVHVVCVQGECKELLLVMSAHQAADSVAYHCVDIGPEGKVKSLVFTEKEERDASCNHVSEVGCYLYEPNAAILKCGGYRVLAARYGLCKLHPNSHLYTSDVLCKDFPGRVFNVEQVSGFGKHELGEMLKNIPKANLAVRNFPETVVVLRKRLRLKEGGDIYLFATTLNDGRHVMIRCRK